MTIRVTINDEEHNEYTAFVYDAKLDAWIAEDEHGKRHYSIKLSTDDMIKYYIKWNIKYKTYLEKDEC